MANITSCIHIPSTYYYIIIWYRVYNLTIIFSIWWVINLHLFPTNLATNRSPVPITSVKAYIRHWKQFLPSMDSKNIKYSCGWSMSFPWLPTGAKYAISINLETSTICLYNILISWTICSKIGISWSAWHDTPINWTLPTLAICCSHSLVSPWDQ